jgi:hypothetical protein
VAAEWWQRWKGFARASAVLQSNALLSILYFVVLVPTAMLQRPFGDLLDRRPAKPEWRPRAAGPRDLDAARRQY